MCIYIYMYMMCPNKDVRLFSHIQPRIQPLDLRGAPASSIIASWNAGHFGPTPDTLTEPNNLTVVYSDK